MNYFKIGSLALLAVLFLISNLSAQPNYPEKFAKDFPQYPDSEVVQVMDIQGGNTVASLDCKDAQMQDVYDFYKSKAVDSGYTVNMETQQQKGLILMVSKANRKVMINVVKEEGRTLFNITWLTGQN